MGHLLELFMYWVVEPVISVSPACTGSKGINKGLGHRNISKSPVPLCYPFSYLYTLLLLLLLLLVMAKREG